jgi:hypothetical protein
MAVAAVVLAPRVTVGLAALAGTMAQVAVVVALATARPVLRAA